MEPALYIILIWRQCYSAPSKLPEPLHERGKLAYTVVSHEFEVVQHSRTFSNHCFTEENGLIPQFHMSLVWFNASEPEPAWISVWQMEPALYIMSLEWFIAFDSSRTPIWKREMVLHSSFTWVQSGSTFSNHCFTEGLGLHSSFTWVESGSTLLNLLESCLKEGTCLIHYLDMGSELFSTCEPSRTPVRKREIGLHSSFTWVWSGSTP